MSQRPRYDKGDWNAICDICGRQYKASELQKRLDGFMVCSDDYEPRQPQDFVRVVADFQAPPYTRPESPDVFIPGVCSPIYVWNNSTIADTEWACTAIVVDANLTLTGTVGIKNHG